MGNNERLVPLDEMRMHAARVSFISSERSVVCAAWIDPTAEKNIPALIPFALTQEKPAFPLYVSFTGQGNAYILQKNGNNRGDRKMHTQIQIQAEVQNVLYQKIN